MEAEMRSLVEAENQGRIVAMQRTEVEATRIYPEIREEARQAIALNLIKQVTRSIEAIAQAPNLSRE
ncbi:hypothetical protein IQ266_24315 [filamentous cyanobacterium LEGE 11480]|uniref:Uncharacterized protein n=1 Tax=Romeriopsis navalis LEGE 11480 TaxID=2777977 RepID=A0A928VQX2_9CYAN|nr:hypothetical protein [Romeriopsis navalis]MBE9032865.1 hypothetical protein [Romeriopsis navalis LEGE 11480]